FVLLMPIPVVPVRLIVAIQAPVGPVHVAGSATIPTVIWTTGSAASHRVFAARCRTILRQRQRSPTRQQRGHNRERLQGCQVRTRSTHNAYSPTPAMKTERESVFLTQIIGWFPFS